MINKVSGKRAFAVSGQTNNSVNDGAFCFNSGYSLLNTNSTVGRQLSYKENTTLPRKPRHSAEYKAIPARVSSAAESPGEL